MSGLDQIKSFDLEGDGLVETNLTPGSEPETIRLAFLLETLTDTAPVEIGKSVFKCIFPVVGKFSVFGGN